MLYLVSFSLDDPACDLTLNLQSLQALQHSAKCNDHFFRSVALSLDITGGPEVKKQVMHCARPDPVRECARSFEVGTRTLTWREIAQWQRENKHITSGYRPCGADYSKTLASLKFLHNETCAIYTHLSGALLLPMIANRCMAAFSQPELSNVQMIDYNMFWIFFLSAECCLVLSTIYHLMRSHSRSVEQMWLWMDLLGIVIVTMGTFVPSIFYAFMPSEITKTLLDDCRSAQSSPSSPVCHVSMLAMH